MKQNPSKLMEKLNTIASAWEEIAPSESFGGMTLDEFKTEIGKSSDARTKLTELENAVTEALQKRDAADDASWNKAQLVVKSVAGNPAFGEDSGLYEAMGYVRKSARKTGLTRKKKADLKS